MQTNHSSHDKQYNQRQLLLMLKKINYYKNNEITHKHLIASLEALIQTLHNFDATWKEEISTLCNRLNYGHFNINDDTLNEEIKTQEKIRMKQYIHKLETIIESRLIKEKQN